jgi:hypothetical protein
MRYTQGTHVHFNSMWESRLIISRSDRIQIGFRNTSPPRSNQPSGVRSLLLKSSRLLGRRSGIPQNIPCTKTLSRMVLKRLESIIQSSIRSPVLFLDLVRISFEYININLMSLQYFTHTTNLHT